MTVPWADRGWHLLEDLRDHEHYIPRCVADTRIEPTKAHRT